MMIDIKFGVNIVEIVTSGLYPNALDTFREYIQNATDAIDDAVKAGILQEGDGQIEIAIDKNARRITIEDNGIGISAARDFVRIMSNIGNSDKTLKSDRGFRGIGRLGGLAYCKTLIFSTKVAGEKKISTLTINAEKLRETFFSPNKYLAEQVLSANMIFDTLDSTDLNEHFFRVELIDVTHVDLLDVKKVRNYLSFVAPVTYSPQFHFQTEIYKHAAALNFTITEYTINVNGEPLSKEYKTTVRTRNGEDEIFNVSFHDFYNANGNLIAWSWIGLSTFKGVINPTKKNPNHMRYIRLRQKNIQIGDEKVFQNRKLFSEDRGVTYFIGEVHTVDPNLRPNSRRDYFEENDACITLEDSLREYFKELYKLYHFASDARSAFNATKRPENFLAGIELHTPEYQDTHLAEHEAELAALESTAAEKKQFIDEQRQEAQDNPVAISSQVFEKIAEQFDASDIEDDNPNTPPRSTAFALVG